MTRRGQDTDTRLARWRDGSCPIHGLGLATPRRPLPSTTASAPDAVIVACPHEECTLVAVQWPGKDRFHSLFGFIAGPDDLKAMLLKAHEIEDDTDRPGRSARQVRTSYQLEE